MNRKTPPGTPVPSRRIWVASLVAVALAALAAALLISVDRAIAHAVYEESDPPFAAVLDTPPERIMLRFSQELFRREGANTISLTNIDSGGSISLGAVEIANEDRHVMSAAVRETLPNGRYEVAWTNLSAEDGDADQGSYPFYVGRDPTAEEIKLDRETAVSLLITYPGDEPPEEEDASTTAAATPTVVRRPNETEAAGGGIGAGVWIWLVIGGGASGVLLASLWRSRGQPGSAGGG